MNYFLFNLFRVLPLLKAPLKIILFPDHVIERAYNLAIMCILQKLTTPKKACVSFLLVGGDRAATLLITSTWI